MTLDALDPGWRDFFAKQRDAGLLDRLEKFMDEEYANPDFVVYPPRENVFRAFEATPLANVKVVILGQDPYHNPGQATGLAFSVGPEGKMPPSLRNIFKELKAELPQWRDPGHGCLDAWAERGVFLLNSILTVRSTGALSHLKSEWETFTDEAIVHLAKRAPSSVFFLWGAKAGAKAPLTGNGRHFVLTAPHPSPLSAHRGFFGCGHFERANRLLREAGREPVDWSLA